MKFSRKIFSVTLASLLVIAVAMPAFSFASSNNSGEDKEHGKPAFVQEKQDLNKLEFMEKHQVRINKHELKFDTPPVIKDGRTLIPVRAITEGLGSKVEWDAVNRIVTITGTKTVDGEEEEVVIVFYLADYGKYEDGDVTVNGELADIDVPPGIHNNRTYVPLRFIAETLGLRVGYDEDSGEIDINEEPKLDPAKIVFKDEEDVKAVEVELLNLGDEFTFEQIKDMDESDYDEEDGVVTISEDYILGLDAEMTKLVFQFKDQDDKILERTFKIVLEYNEGDLEDDDDVVLDPESATFEGSDIEVTLPEDYDLIRIKNGSKTLVLDTDYSIEDSVVTLDDEYLDNLDEDTDLKFIVEKDDEQETLKFEVNIE